MNAKSISRRALPVLVFGLVSLQSLAALDWEPLGLEEGAAAADVVATAVDRAGREHAVYTFATESAVEVHHYLISHSGTVPDVRIVATATNALEQPAYLSVDVAPDFTVVIGMVNAGGDLSIYEKAPGASAFTRTLSRPATALGDSTGGISVVAAGNGFSFHSVAFTGTNGSLKFIEKNGSWSTAQNVTTSANTGLAPVLIETSGGSLAPTTRPRMIVSCNTAGQQVQASFYSLITNSWESPQQIEALPFNSFTRPDADSYQGRIGVSYETSSSNGEGTTYLVRYGEYTGTWALQTVASSNELGSLDFFPSTTGMRFDAAGHPMVAYQRDIFAFLSVVTRDQRLRRFIPGLGWELSIVQAPESGYAETFDVATDAAGDPVLLTGVDQSGDTPTIATLHRPVNLPWSCEVPPALSSSAAHTFAPALATAPDGTVYLAAGVASQSGIFSPRSYLAPRLYAFKDGQVTTTVIPSSSNPHLANALAVGSDGTVHLVTLRVSTTSSTSGDLLYFRIKNGVVIASTVVDDGGVDIGIAARQPIRLGITGAGRLYLSYGRAGGGITLASLAPDANLAPGQRPWETYASTSLANVGDLAVRADGGVAVSFFNASNRTLNVLANVIPSTGTLLVSGAFSVTPITTLAVSETAPLNVACVFGLFDKPVLAACVNSNAVRIYEPSPSGTTAYTQLQPLLTPDCRPELLFDRPNQFYHLAFQTSRDGGTIEHRRISASGMFAVLDGAFVNPGVGLSQLGGDFVGTLDCNGLPWLAQGFLSTSTLIIANFDDILLCRPADSLDADGDGVPLLLEHAHMMADNYPDAALLPHAVTARNGTNVEAGFVFRHPDVAFAVSSNAIGFGDFRFDLIYSNDLGLFSTPPFFAGSPLSSALPAPAAGTGERSFRMNFSEAFREIDPQGFVRLQVNRMRP